MFAGSWELAKLANILPCITTPEYRDWPSAHYTALKLGAANGYRGLCLAGAEGELGKGGVLEEGALADVSLWDLTSLALLPKTDPVSLLIQGSRTQAGLSLSRGLCISWLSLWWPLFYIKPYNPKTVVLLHRPTIRTPCRSTRRSPRGACTLPRGARRGQHAAQLLGARRARGAARRARQRGPGQAAPGHHGGAAGVPRPRGDRPRRPRHGGPRRGGVPRRHGQGRMHSVRVLATSSTT